MAIKLYNTMTRKKEEFIPREPGKVSMYVCGPTTYNFIHIGNARPMILFDTIRRYFEYVGYTVTYVQNFTDIDDKIINRAQEEKMDALELARKYTAEYYKDAKALGTREATIQPKVSEHLPEIIDMIQKIIDNAYAYEVDGDVYFSVRSFENYGKLSGRSLDDMRAGARVEIDERKKDPMDFALWKSAKPGEPSWASPWGKGRPGWHIECSAMSVKYLGMGFDIHGGGFDLIFPHHENEIAQAEACGGPSCGPFAKYWMHNGFITVNEEKMSKSLGNFFTVREILAKYNPEVVRFYMLSTHYRNPLDFDDNKLDVAQKGLDRLKNAIGTLEDLLKNAQIGQFASNINDLNGALLKAKEDFTKAMDDDFNTSLAIAVLFDLARETNSFANNVVKSALKLSADAVNMIKEALKLYREFGQVLGILGQQEHNDAGIVDKLMELIISIRQDARSKKDWAISDAIRDKLGEIGIVIEDSPQGVRWKNK